MTNTSNDKGQQNKTQRDESTIDHLVDEVYEDKPAEGHVQSPTTDSDLSVEDQVREEWDPKKGGLPTS